MAAESLRRISVLGREQNLAVLIDAFDAPSTRIVTLVGPGGIGKTTLAAELATRLAARRPGARIVFVDLDGAATSADLVDRVVAACGGAAASDAGAVLDGLGEAVVVLDDFDALVATEASATLLAWVGRCSELELLVTSRERLGIRDESVYEVGPLEPSSAGVELLVATARRAVIGFAPRPEDTAILVELASMLEGVPLALELCGARLPRMGARDVLTQLRTGMALERRNHDGGPARHASTAAAVRGSWELLAPHERDLLAQLTVFRGGFTHATVRAIVDLPCDSAGALESLHARSLVRSRDAGRYDLYGQVRDFVISAHPAPIAAATARHASWFVAEAERVALHAHANPEARRWLVTERENVLEVARRVLGGEPPTAARAEAALRAVVAAKEILLARGPTAALAALVSPIVERTRDSGANPKLSARVLLLRGALRREHGDVRASLKDLLAAESVARAVADPLLAAEAAFELGRTLRAAGELDAARQSFDKAARAFAEHKARVHEAEAIALLGTTAGASGDLVTARALIERAIALAGDDQLLGAPLHLMLARALAEAADRAGACKAAEAAELRGRRDGDPAVAGQARLLRGLVLHAAGDLDGGGSDLAIARDVFTANGFDVWAAIASGHLGVIAREQGRSAAAYAALADAHDAVSRAKRLAHAAYFSAHLAGIEAGLGRKEAASQLLDRLGDTCEADAWWPFSADGCVQAQRTGTAASAGTSLLVRIFARSLNAPGLAPPPSEDALLVGAGGTWFRPPRGTRVGLERRRTLALLLEHLAAARLERTGQPVRASALFAVAWPGEKALASAAAHRVRVAVATLRKMGLRDCLVTTPDGYCLSPDVELVSAA